MYNPWLRLWLDAGAAQLAAWETIARRLDGFAVASKAGRLHADPELATMVTEKWMAAAQGMMAAGPALMFAAPLLARHPERAPEVAAKVASAALAPAYRRTRANARRLRRKRKS